MDDKNINTLISKMQSSPPNASAIQPSINSTKIITKGGKRRRKSRRRKKLLGGNTFAVTNIPRNSVSPGVNEMYQKVNQSIITNSVQSMMDGGRIRKKSKRIRRSRRRSI